MDRTYHEEEHDQDSSTQTGVFQSQCPVLAKSQHVQYGLSQTECVPPWKMASTIHCCSGLAP